MSQPRSHQDLDLEDFDDRIDGYRLEIKRIKHELAESQAARAKLVEENRQLRELIARIVAREMRRQSEGGLQ